jgi:hypothetical protein
MTSGITPVAATPDRSGTIRSDGWMQLTGTLLRRGAGFALEEQITADTGSGFHWTTPRLYRLELTDATRDVADAAIGQVFRASGTPSRTDRRLGAAIVIDNVELLLPASRTR